MASLESPRDSLGGFSSHPIQPPWWIVADRSSRAFANFAVQLDVTTALFDEAKYLAQTQSSTFAEWLGGKEGIERTRQDILCHACPRIANTDQHVLSRRDLGVLGGVLLIDVSVGNDNDTISGDNDADRLFGEAGDDMLNGNHGTDALDGGAGTDTCNGGDGADTATNCEAVSSVP